MAYGYSEGSYNIIGNLVRHTIKESVGNERYEKICNKDYVTNEAIQACCMFLQKQISERALVEVFRFERLQEFFSQLEVVVIIDRLRTFLPESHNHCQILEPSNGGSTTVDENLPS